MNNLHYPDSAIAVLADFNGVSPDEMRRVWPVASNQYMLDWMDALGARHAAGLPIYSEPGRLIVPSALI